LITQDSGYNVVPDLAQWWEVLDDGKTHVFHLHKNVKWHDGVDFTSADVKFHYDNIAQGLPQSSPPTGFFNKLVSIETPDDYTVIFKHSEPVSLYSYAHAQASTLILPKHIYENTDMTANEANWDPVGTGPYKVTEYVKDQHVIMEANEDYFKGKPHLDKIIWRILPDSESRILALEKGEVDFIYGVTGINIDRLEENPDIEVKFIPGTRIRRLWFNRRPGAIEEYPWLDDENVRIALVHAIDTESIINDVYNGAAYDSHNVFTKATPDFYNWESHEEFPEYNPQLAEELLDQAGYPRGSDGVRFRIDKVLERADDPLGEVIKFYWKEIGVEAELFPVEYGTALSVYDRGPEGMTDEIPLYIGAGGYTPDAALFDTYYSDHSVAPMNTNFGSDEVIDEIVSELANTVALGRRKELILDFQERHMDLFYEAILLNEARSWAWNKEFAGLDEHPIPVYVLDPIGVGAWWTEGTSAQEVITETITETVTETITEQVGIDTTTAIIGIIIAAIIGFAVGFYMKKT
jgi:peptide/nickel transport system substrate-binding protein